MLLLATFGLAFAVYCALCALGRPPVVHHVKHNLVFGPFLARFLVWLIGPIERLLVGRVSANVITRGVARAVRDRRCVRSRSVISPSAVWLFAFAGILDVLDGRLAR